MEDIPSSEAKEMSKDSEVVEGTFMDDSRHQEDTSIEPPQENEEILPQKPLAYGDLVMADYTEKRRTYKWPAIVHKCLYLLSNDRSSLQTI
jgi:hypothetical protein